MIIGKDVKLSKGSGESTNIQDQRTES